MKIIKLLAAVLLGLLIGLTITVEGTIISEDNIPSEAGVKGLTLEDTNNIEEILNYLSICDAHMTKAHNMANEARNMGYADNHIIIQIAKKEYDSAFNLKNKYGDKLVKLQAQEQLQREKIEKERMSQKEQEYPVSTYIWRYLKECGYNDYVCAGILGNLMAETGGQTLNVRWNISGNGYYGMCQWNKGHTEVWGANLQGQCKYLIKTIRHAFNNYGRNYAVGFNYEQFINLNNEQEAALAFAACYERCASFSYGVRKKNATVAYNYFTN